MLRQISSCTIFSRKGAQQVFDAQDRSTSVLKPIRYRMHWKESPNEKVQTFHMHRLFFTREDHKQGTPT